MLTGCATYRAGVALPGTDTPIGALDARGPGRLVWMSLNDPSEEEVDRLAAILHLDDHVADLLDARHVRPGLFTAGEVVVFSAVVASYDPVKDLVDIGSLTSLVGPDLLLTIVRHGPSEVRDLRRPLEQTDTMAHGPWAVVRALMDRVVTGYGQVLTDLRGDVEQLEREAFTDGTNAPNITQRIYLLKREAIDFRQGAAALIDPLDDLADGLVATPGVEVRSWAVLRDHLSRVVDRSLVVSDLLGGILTAYQTDVALRQNEDMRKISAWVAIAAVPTLLAGIYGMNFDHMPELGLRYGYPALVGVMALVCVGLWVLFRRKDWL